MYIKWIYLYNTSEKVHINLVVLKKLKKAHFFSKEGAAPQKLE